MRELPEIIRVKVIDRIASLKKERGRFTQAMLAEKVGSDQGTVNSQLTGKVKMNFSLETLEKWAKALETTPEALIADVPSRPPNDAEIAKAYVEGLKVEPDRKRLIRFILSCDAATIKGLLGSLEHRLPPPANDDELSG